MGRCRRALLVGVGMVVGAVACGDGGLELVELQKPGGRRLPAAQCLAAGAPALGQRLPCPAD